MQIEHEIAVRADVLTDFVDHEEQAEIFASGVYILFDFPDKLFDGKVGGFCAVKPVAGSRLAHAERGDKRVYDVVLKKRERIAGRFPAVAVDFFKFCPEAVRFPSLFNELFQPRNFQIVAVKPAVFIEHLGKYAQDRRFVLGDRAFGVNIKEDRVRRHAGAVLQLGIEHRVVEFVRKVLDGMLPGDNLIGQKIRENFQKVRFTAAEETGDPYADLVRRLG